MVPRWEPLQLPVRVANTIAEALQDCQSVGRNNFVIKFLRRARRLNLPHPHTVLVWDLSMDSISKDHPADNFSVGQACCMGCVQELLVSTFCLEFGVMTVRSSTNPGMDTYLKCSLLHLE